MVGKYLFLGLFITILLTGIFLPSCGRVNNSFSSAHVTSTAIPPALLTQIVQDIANQSATQAAFPPLATQAAQTEQAFQLTFAASIADTQEEYPILNNVLPSPGEILFFKPQGVLAGDGILYEDSPSTDTSQKYRFDGLIWEERTSERVIWVRGGQASELPTQGAIRISIAANSYNSDVVIESPVAAGKLTITGA